MLNTEVTLPVTMLEMAHVFRGFQAAVEPLRKSIPSLNLHHSGPPPNIPGLLEHIMQALRQVTVQYNKAANAYPARYRAANLDMEVLSLLSLLKALDREGKKLMDNWGPEANQAFITFLVDVESKCRKSLKALQEAEHLFTFRPSKRTFYNLAEDVRAKGPKLIVDNDVSQEPAEEEHEEASTEYVNLWLYARLISSKAEEPTMYQTTLDFFLEQVDIALSSLERPMKEYEARALGRLNQVVRRVIKDKGLEVPESYVKYIDIA